MHTSAKPVVLHVLGTPRIFYNPAADTANGSGREITEHVTRRQRELLTFLALHPDGVRRDTMAELLWPTNTAKRPGSGAVQRHINALHTTLSRLRRRVSQATNGEVTELTWTSDERYGLNRDIVDVDYWHFSAAVAALRTATNHVERLAAHERILAAYGGPLGDGIDAEWIEPVREATRRDALDSVAALADNIADQQPQRALDLLETARAFDPYNEDIYRRIMWLQHRIGRYDAIPRTLGLLATRLVEIDEQPSTEIAELAKRLREPAPVRTDQSMSAPLQAAHSKGSPPAH